jgi:hypothetical protein
MGAMMDNLVAIKDPYDAKTDQKSSANVNEALSKPT